MSTRLCSPGRRVIGTWVAAVAVLVSITCSPVLGADTSPMPLRVQLHWLHQAQFAGYYLAEARALQRRTAKEFELIEGGPGIDSLDALAKGEVDVAIGWLGSALDARTKGADIVNIAQIFRRPGMALACLRSSGVRRAADAAGRPIGVWNVGDQISVHLWFQRARIPDGSIKLVQQAADGKDLITGRVPCGTVMLYNEYWSLRLAGLKRADLNLVRFGDAGLGMLEDGLYVRRANLDNPDFRRRVVAFLKAAAEGWRESREHRDKAIAAVLAKAPAADAAHQRRMLDAVLNLIDPNAPFGLLAPAEYQRTVDIFVHNRADGEKVRAAAANGWSHRIWQEAGLDTTARSARAVK